MSYELDTSRTQRTLTGRRACCSRCIWMARCSSGLCLLVAVGTIVLFSASGRSLSNTGSEALRFGWRWS